MNGVSVYVLCIYYRRSAGVCGACDDEAALCSVCVGDDLILNNLGSALRRGESLWTRC